MDAFSLTILTPQKVYAEQEVESLTFKTSQGERTLLAHHMDLIADVEISPLILRYNGHVTYYACSGGTFTFSQKENHGYLYTQAIENVKDIDSARATKAKEEAEKLMDSANDNHAYKKAEIRLKKALNRLDVKAKYKNI